MFKTEDRLRERQASEKFNVASVPADFGTTIMVPLKPAVLGIYLNPLAFVSLSSFCEVTDSLTFTWSISAPVRPGLHLVWIIPGEQDSLVLSRRFLVA